MKSTSIKSALFAALVLISLSCFVYVNTTAIDRTLQVQGISQPSVDAAPKMEKNGKTLDLALFKGAITLIQTFFPAK
jgi:hypothetical protein